MSDKQHPIQGVMETAMRNIKDMVDVNTVVGDPITVQDGTVIIPVSKVGFGFASGGSDFDTKNSSRENPCFGGGSGAGITVTPVAFLVINKSGSVSMLNIDNPQMSAVDKAIEMVPGLIEKLKETFTKKENAEQDQ